VPSCTMIITSAKAFTRAIHDRMLVLLDAKHIAAWLSGIAGTELFMPASDDLLRMWPVSKRVNRPGRGDIRTLIEKVALG
jgi:putative SOS response-associated peptidase YedK